MKLVRTTQERDLAASLRELFATHCPPDLVRALREPGGDRVPEKLWESLVAAEVLALPFAEDVGGAGGTLDDLAVVYAEAGRALCPTVVLSTLHLGLAVAALGSAEQQARVLAPLCRGELRGAVALGSPYDAADVRPTLRAEPIGGDRVAVSGRLDHVLDADLAHRVLATATLASYGEPDRLVGVLLDPRAPGITRTALPTSDADRLQQLDLDHVVVPAADVLTGPEGVGLAADGVRRVALLVRALQCVDMAAGADAVLERTVGHVRGREQFGRAIASFQAAQHLVADVHIAVQAARLAARSAVFWHGRGRPAVRETAVAVLHAATAYRRATLDGHQLHGGMGYVVETDLHLWSERARLLGALGGGPDVAARWLEEEITRG
ncbi:acyl-CoA dehydrogenase [Nocardioides sp. dk4132]|uniref:acyl-CoA dehydrogenase family protein n=1 Tax=unclassified Nocardioides TaxID=2615069 RepID=UPI001296E8A0|nr:MULTISPECIES: acyl-CoA dehydrogenase family protein [unclassified Nocardioides]MQW78044.1 acyl-CoA dehydrogenase [Nocardioides sp. dk4132]QGA08148.1 acyl-CoA dehydrogenase [Nocardioides sp. dk884]